MRGGSNSFVNAEIAGLTSLLQVHVMTQRFSVLCRKRSSLVMLALNDHDLRERVCTFSCFFANISQEEWHADSRSLARLCNVRVTIQLKTVLEQTPSIPSAVLTSTSIFLP